MKNKVKTRSKPSKQLNNFYVRDALIVDYSLLILVHEEYPTKYNTTLNVY